MKTKTVERPHFTIWEEDGVLFCEFYKETLTLEDAMDNVSERHKNFETEKPAPSFIDLSRVKNVSKEARDYFSSKEAVRNISAAAIYAPSLITKMLANFFITFNKPRVPLRVFSNKEDALKWLRKYV